MARWIPCKNISLLLVLLSLLLLLIINIIINIIIIIIIIIIIVIRPKILSEHLRSNDDNNNNNNLTRKPLEQNFPFKVHITTLTKFRPETPYDVKCYMQNISKIGMIINFN